MALPGPKIRSLGARSVVALVVVFLLFGPYCANRIEASTRRVLIWQTRDTVLLLGCIVLIALACVLAGELVRWLKRPLLTRIFNHLFVVALGAGLLANLWFHTNGPTGYRITQYGMEIRILWLLLAAVAGYSLAKPDSKLVLRSRQLCQIVSPAVLILAFEMFRTPTYPSGIDPLPAPVPASAVRAGGPEDSGPPVYLFLLDAWSYVRTYENRTLRPIFPNLAEVSRQSIVFHDARSPGPNTNLSIPGLLFQTDLPVVADERGYGFDRDGAFIPAADMKNIFSVVADRNYHTFVLGFTLSYRLWLGDQVEVYRSYPWLVRYHGHRILAEAGLHAFKAMHYWTDPCSSYLDWKFRLRLDTTWWVWTLRDMKRDALNILAAQPRNTFALLHYPLPHYPYVHNEDGSYRGFDKKAWDICDPEGYERNLVCTDVLIGEFVTTLRQAGRYDDAMLILTSDHRWGADPELNEGGVTSPSTHVPLIVKLPNQSRPATVASRFENHNLGTLIDGALRMDRDVEDIERWLKTAAVEGEARATLRQASR